MGNSRKLAVGALAALSGMLLALPANAIPTLRITEGANIVTVTDNGTGDINPFLGAVVFSGTVGNFIVNTVSGATKPILGSSTSPLLDLNSLNINGTAGSQIILEFSENDFTTSGQTLDLPSLVGGTTVGTLRYQTFASLTNIEFARDILIADSGIMQGGFLFNAVATAALSGSYSLTTVVTITHSAQFSNSSFNAILEISEPAFAPPIVIGVLVLSANMASRRRKRAIRT